MKPIPQNILRGFNDLMKLRKVPPMFLGDYRKWLLYFLDFRAKYPLPDSPSDQVRMFSDKLRSKNQTAGQVEQAENALSLFFASDQAGNIGPLSGDAPAVPLSERRFERIGNEDHNSNVLQISSPMVCEPPGGFQFAQQARNGRRYDEWRCLRKTESPAWDAIIEKLAAEIQVRHYFAKNAQALCGLGPQVSELS